LVGEGGQSARFGTADWRPPLLGIHRSARCARTQIRRLMLGANIEGVHYIENLPRRKFLLGRDFGGNHLPSPKDFKQKIAKRTKV
jgi:hypothetical protein